MQQIIVQTKFSVLFDAIKTENVQHLEEKIQPIKKIFIEKICIFMNKLCIFFHTAVSSVKYVLKLLCKYEKLKNLHKGR